MAHSIIKWFGGKSKMITTIIDKVNEYPNFKLFIDVFGGSCIVTLSVKELFPHKTYFYNDLNAGLVTLFRVCQNKESYEKLKHKLSYTTYSEEEHDKAFRLIKDALINGIKINDVTLAWATFVYNRMSFAGIFQTHTKSGFAIDRSGEHNFALEFENKIRSLDSFRTSLNGITLLNKNFSKVFELFEDNKNALFFIDPPYSKSVTNKPYKLNIGGTIKDWDEIDEMVLFSCLEKVKGKFILTYDNYNKKIENFCNIKVIKETSTTSRGESKKAFDYYLISNFENINQNLLF
jgi:site-specific DNA-adenine methylase